MNMIHLMTAIASIVTATSVLHWVVASRRYRRGLALAQARHEKQRQASTENLDRVKRQIGQLQEDLSNARQEIKRLTRERPKAAAAPATAKPSIEQARQDLLHVLVDKPPRHTPAHGFADTLPSRQFEDTQIGMVALER